MTERDLSDMLIEHANIYRSDRAIAAKIIAKSLRSGNLDLESVYGIAKEHGVRYAQDSPLIIDTILRIEAFRAQFGHALQLLKIDANRVAPSYIEQLAKAISEAQMFAPDDGGFVIASPDIIAALADLEARAGSQTKSDVNVPGNAKPPTV